MSLSKVYKDTASFVPEQILPRQGASPESSWHDLTPTGTNGQGIHPAAHHFIADGQTDTEDNLSPDTLSESEINREETPIATINVDEIRQQAFSEGVLEGRRQADEDFGTCVLTLRAACTQLNHLHETILRNNLDEMHTLVMEIAEKIIRHSVQEQSDTILATIEDAIRLAVKSDEFQIRINQQDLETIKQKKKEIIDEISGLDNIILKADNTVDRGGCLLESPNCTVDATITGQLQVIKEALQADHSTPSSFQGEP